MKKKSKMIPMQLPTDTKEADPDLATAEVLFQKAASMLGKRFDFIQRIF